MDALSNARVNAWEDEQELAAKVIQKSYAKYKIKMAAETLGDSTIKSFLASISYQLPYPVEQSN